MTRRAAVDILALLAGLATLAAFTFEKDPWQAGMGIGFLVCVFALVDLADHPPRRRGQFWIGLAMNDAKAGDPVSITTSGYQRLRLGHEPWETAEVLPLDWDWALWKDFSVTMRMDAQAAMNRMGVPAQSALEKLGDEIRERERAQPPMFRTGGRVGS